MSAVLNRETQEHKQRLAEALTGRLDELYTSHAVTLGDAPEEVARRMVSSVPRQHVYDESIGPFYDTEGVRKVLSCNGKPVSRQAIFDRIARVTILAAKTADGRWAFPTFQFAGDEVLPGLRDVLAVFRGVPVDGWAVAAWLNAPSPTLEETSAVQWLREGRPTAAVLAEAQEAATRWSAP